MTATRPTGEDSSSSFAYLAWIASCALVSAFSLLVSSFWVSCFCFCISFSWDSFSLANLISSDGATKFLTPEIAERNISGFLWITCSFSASSSSGINSGGLFETCALGSLEEAVTPYFSICSFTSAFRFSWVVTSVSAIPAPSSYTRAKFKSFVFVG